MAARHYDFTKIGLGAVTIDGTTGKPEVGIDGQFKVAEEMYMVRSQIPSGQGIILTNCQHLQDEASHFQAGGWDAHEGQSFYP